MKFEEIQGFLIFGFSVIGGFGFGLWQESASAGVFASVVIIGLWRNA